MSASIRVGGLLLAGVVSAAVVSVATAATAAGAQPAEIIVSVGSVSVTRDELLDVLIAERKSGNLLRLAGASSEEGIERLARALLETKLMAEAARERGIAALPEVSRQLTRSADVMLAEALVRQVHDALDTGGEAARRFYDDHQDRFRSLPRRKARHIVVADRAAADAALAQLRGGADFAALASSLNRDATRASGGDLGWVARGVMVKSFDAALFALGKGELSTPIETSFGWHVVLVEDVDPGALPPFELITPRVIDAMKLDATESLKASVVAGRTVSINREVLGRLIQ